MLKIKKNYFWNIVSIILIIIIAETAFFLKKVKTTNKYNIVQSTKISFFCEFDNTYAHLNLKFCQKFISIMLNPIQSYITSYYSLGEKEYFNKVNGNAVFFTSYYNLEKNEKIKKINEKEFEKYISKITGAFLKKVKTIEINNYLVLESRLRIESYISQEYMRYLSNFEIEEINNMLLNLQANNIEDINYLIKELENIKLENIYKANFEYSKNKIMIKDKFSRLNYLNVLLISFIFAVFVNIITTILLQNNLLKK